MPNAGSAYQIFHEDEKSCKWPTRRKSKQGWIPQVDVDSNTRRQGSLMRKNRLYLERLPATSLKRSDLQGL